MTRLASSTEDATPRLQVGVHVARTSSGSPARAMQTPLSMSEKPSPDIAEERMSGMTVEVQQAPARVIVEQPAPRVVVERQAPRVTVEQPPPQVTVTQPEPEVTVSQERPRVEVVQEDPEVVVPPTTTWGLEDERDDVSTDPAEREQLEEDVGSSTSRRAPEPGVEESDG